MSTAVDTAFEAIVTAPGEAPEELHYTCNSCYPGVPPGSQALCGHMNVYGIKHLDEGRPRCAKCLALSTRAAWPCGHR